MQRPSRRYFSCTAIAFASLILCSSVNAEETSGSAESSPAPSPAAILNGAFETSVTDQADHEGTPNRAVTPSAAADWKAPQTLDLTARPDDIWERIRHGFAIPNIDTPLVAQQQAWYLSHQANLQRAIERSGHYLFHVIEELEKRGMPTELALLPFVESAYNPMALSTAQASGMWQFMPSTGKNFNLKQSWWQDERRDVIASTDAALSYLQNIYEMHGDWHLALASYNWGQGSVKRAIEKNQALGLPTDYLNLKMPDETRNYIPKLQAIKNIIANPELFGVKLARIDNQPYFAQVDTSINKLRDMDVATAARMAEMPVDEFKALNPSFNRPVIRGVDTANLILPMDRISIFEANRESNVQPLATWQAYTTHKGETLNKVASRFGMSANYLMQVNSLGNKTRLRPGTTLLVQTKNSSDPMEHLALAKMSEAPVLVYASKNTKSASHRHASIKARTMTAQKNHREQHAAAKSATGRKNLTKLAAGVGRKAS